MRVKFFLLIFSLIFPLSTFSEKVHFPKPQGYVNDFAGIIKSEDKSKIEKFAKELEEKTTVEFAVVTIKSTKPLSIEEYAVRLFESWGIGKKDKNNGLLLLVALEDRAVKIEVGYGLEEIIPDIVAHRIIYEFLIPNFKEEQYSKGILLASLKLFDILSKEYKIKLEDLQNEIKSIEYKENLYFILFVLVVFFVVFGFLILSGTGIFYNGRGSIYWGGGFGGFGGGFRGGGFGGGFGGGLSGGGGAVGRW